MLDEVDSLLQTRQFHQHAHFLLAAIKHEVDFGHLDVTRLVRCQVQSGDNRVEVKFLGRQLQLSLTHWVLACECSGQIFPFEKNVLKALQVANLLKLAFEGFEVGDVVA